MVLDAGVTGARMADIIAMLAFGGFMDNATRRTTAQVHPFARS